MKYEKFIKIAVGIVAVAVLFVVPTMASATVATPGIFTVAGDNYINNSEQNSFLIIGTTTATSTASAYLTINLSDGSGHSATTTSGTLTSATTTYSVAITNASSTVLAQGSITVKVYEFDGVATSSAKTTTVTLDTVAPSFSAVNILSNNASTTLAKTSDVITLYATSSEAVTAAPTVTFTFNGTASASSSVVYSLGSNAYKATVAASSTDADGVVGFTISGYSDTAGNSGSSQTAVTAGPIVTFDKTAPTISTAVWNDANGSTNIDAGDTIVITFSEVMATTTISTTTLGLSGSHTFGNSTLAWSGTSSSTILTVTLGSSSTVASGDTINPTSAVTDAVGNVDASTDKTITDSTGPLTPVSSLDAGTYTSTQTATLTSTGSSNIYYTVDGSTPSCSSILYNGTFVIINHSLTLEAVGCDAYSNVSSVLSVGYVIRGSAAISGSGGGGGSGYSYVAPPVTPITLPAVAPITPKALAGKTFSKDLFVGSTGDDVVTLQTFLEQSGYLVMPNGVAKGYFGGLTKKAVMNFQKDAGLPIVGRVGPLTRGILNKGQ
jgi:Putative peptidoglycan binding domain/Fn3 associated